jgi:hypothetical protein
LLSHSFSASGLASCHLIQVVQGFALRRLIIPWFRTSFSFRGRQPSVLVVSLFSGLGLASRHLISCHLIPFFPDISFSCSQLEVLRQSVRQDPLAHWCQTLVARQITFPLPMQTSRARYILKCCVKLSLLENLFLCEHRNGLSSVCPHVLVCFFRCSLCLNSLLHE